MHLVVFSFFSHQVHFSEPFSLSLSCFQKHPEQSRRDDLESLGYMLLYLFFGKLPWQGIKAVTKQEKYDKIGRAKLEHSMAEHCKGAPSCFASFLEYCRALEFTQEPDYDYLRGVFQGEVPDKNLKDVSQFDWLYQVRSFFHTCSFCALERALCFWRAFEYFSARVFLRLSMCFCAFARFCVCDFFAQTDQTHRARASRVQVHHV